VRILSTQYGSLILGKATMNTLKRYEHSGHGYPGLIEGKGDLLLPKCMASFGPAIFGASTWSFFKVTREHLIDGMKILL
jgi:hypothetical protein